MCKKVIPKNEIRIGKVVKFKKIEIKQYHHIHCAFSALRKARDLSNTIRSVANLTGFDELGDEEKERIKNLIDEHNASIEMTGESPPKKIPVKKKKALRPS